MRRDSVAEWTLSVWRDFEPPRALARSDGQEPTQVFRADSDFQEEVCSWRVREDVFAGISDDAVRAGLRERLFDGLDDAKPPADRRLGVLRQFVDAAEAAMDEASPHPIETWPENEADDGEPVVVYVNALLALTIHLKWLLACFGDRPGVSVSVR